MNFTKNSSVTAKGELNIFTAGVSHAFIDDVEPNNIDLHLGIGYRDIFADHTGWYIEVGFNHQLKKLANFHSDYNPKLYNLNIGGGICVSLINK